MNFFRNAPALYHDLLQKKVKEVKTLSLLRHFFVSALFEKSLRKTLVFRTLVPLGKFGNVERRQNAKKFQKYSQRTQIKSINCKQTLRPCCRVIQNLCNPTILISRSTVPLLAALCKARSSITWLTPPPLLPSSLGTRYFFTAKDFQNLSTIF